MGMSTNNLKTTKCEAMHRQADREQSEPVRVEHPQHQRTQIQAVLLFSRCAGVCNISFCIMSLSIVLVLYMLKAISGRLSLRPPQEESLLALAQAIEVAPDVLKPEPCVVKSINYIHELARMCIPPPFCC